MTRAEINALIDQVHVGGGWVVEVAPLIAALERLKVCEDRLRDESDRGAVREFTAHTLTLKFHRFLSQAEWQKVAKAVDLFVPFVQEMDANAVVETAEELARVRFQPLSTRAPSQASDQKKDEV